MFFSEGWIRLVDPLLIAMLILLVFLGYQKGFLSKILSCFSFLVIVVLGWNLAPMFSRVFHILPKSYAPYQDTPLAGFFYNYANQILIFVVIVAFAMIGIFLLKPLILLFKKIPVISTANALLGACLGILEMLLLCFVMLFVLHTPMVKNGSEVIAKTFFGKIEVLQEKVVTIGSDVLQSFDLMSQSLLNEASVQDLKIFLSEHGYSDIEIQAFIEQLGK